ncbi:PTS lactose/cellobiose transporter subunit IIA [Atopobium sp. oral taxon 199]|uniref:PTS lactose/cellobiose transporter subunit IIA n=1 Tax=Atopobium sp. oral taxon 199 TaxID=712156 RepID=UPI00034E73DA|nr:PTS lactose/cellobiose transporter subunit IIA [Atopobium sp. oral taxon 199]EPD78508.1 PTS system, cellobiose-specific IIA component [Atopobium sp. oral taxon 199 str. F0494]
MNEKDVEAIVSNLVVHGGDAKSLAIEAIKAARQGDFEHADSLMQQSTDALNSAHEFQMRQIQQEVVGEKNEMVSLLMVHGQDHLMNAITVHDLADQTIALCKQLAAGGFLNSSGSANSVLA